MTGPDDTAPDALRQLVREVLRDVLPTLANGTSPALSEDPHVPAGGPDPVPPSRPPTSVPRSDSAQASSPGAGNPVDMAFTGTRPGESHTHGGGSSRAGSSRAGSSRAGAGRGGTALPGGDSDHGLQAVRLSTDAELHAFVLRILHLADNPKRRRDILAGRLRFTLAAGGHQAPAVTQRVDKGAVTERAVIAAARAGARLLLGPRAVLTPLAKDKARALGVPVEKER